MEIQDGLIETAANIKLLALDCDGVLTDGRLYLGRNGEELKVFHVHDGYGIVKWKNAGLLSAVITARESPMVSSRAEELGIDHVAQNAKDKASELLNICRVEGIDASECAYVGDDNADLAAFEVAGLPIAVANAVPEVLAAASLVTSKSGGAGAVREVVEALLASRN